MSTLAQRSFAAGELSPSLYARTDLQRYFTGLKTARNVFIKRSGGAENRSGTEFIAEVKDSTKTVRYIPFVFSSTQTYVLEFGNLYFRVIKDGTLQTLTSQAITGITNANPGVLTYGGADTYANGDIVYVAGVVGAIANNINGRWVMVGSVNTGSNTFNMLNLDGTNLNTTSLGAYASGGTIAEAYTVTTTYAEADLPNLKFAQSADVITITHPSYVVREVARTADTAWTITDVTFAPVSATPTGASAIVVGATATEKYYYLVTAVDATTFEESLPTSILSVTNGVTPMTSANYVFIDFATMSGAGYYNIYKAVNNSASIYGFIGTTTSSSFYDFGYTPDTADRAPNAAARTIFNTTDAYPSCVLYSQQRRLFANTNNDTEIVNGSKTGLYKNFQTNFPIQDDNAIDFSLSGNQVNTIRHMVDLGQIILFTDSGEKVAQGDANGVLTPSAINLKQYSYNGSANNPAPIVVDNSAIYVQNGGSIIRDLGFDISVDGYKGNDLTIFNSHLFDGYTITRWGYQKVPNSIIWAVRSDGVLLSLTYIKEQQMLAWTRHDMGDDLVEDVCCVPNGSTYDVYLVVKRTIGAGTKRYMERMTDRFFDDVKDYNFTDSSLTYDGRNTGATTMTLSGSGWTYDDTLTITASAAYFASTDVGNEIHMYDSEGAMIRFQLKAYTSTTVMTGKPTTTVPATLQAVAVTNWGKAVDDVYGAFHLEGKSVSVLGDGYVVGSPNNPAYPAYTVTSGALSFPKCYTVIRVGLPFISDIQTLSIDSFSGETIADKRALVSEVTLQVEKTRGIFAGTRCPEDDITNSDDDALFGLYEIKARQYEAYDVGVDTLKGKYDVNVESTWEGEAGVFLRQVDPLPMSVLSIMPKGLYPFRQSGG